MRIWHVGGADTPETVDGLNATVWSVARAQAALGHKVYMIVSELKTSVKNISKETGIIFIPLSNNKWGYDTSVLKDLE